MSEFSCDDLIRINNELTEAKNQMAAFLSLTQSICISYKIEYDEFHIFMMGDGNEQIDIFSGSLDKWSDSMHVSNNIHNDYFDEFEELIQDFRCGEKFILKTVKVNLFGENETMRKCLVSGKTQVIDGVSNVYAVVSFLKETKKLEETSSVASEMLDEETGLLKKEVFEEFAKKQMEDSNTEETVTLASIELDNFEQIIENYGEDFANDVIKRAAKIVLEAVGNKGKAGRISKDRMAIAVSGLVDNESRRSVLRAISNNVKWMYNIGQDNIITCSIGSSSYPDEGLDFDTIMSISDKMLDLAKEKGKNRYLIYLDEIHRDYILGGKAVEPGDKRFFKYRRIRSMNTFIKEFTGSSEDEKLKLIEMISLSLGLDGLMIYDRTKKCKQSLFGNDQTEDSIDFLEMDNYIPNFREDGLLVVDKLETYETKAPGMYNVYSKAGIRQTVQYVVGGNINKSNDVLVSCYRNSLLGRWSEQEINYIAIISEIIGSDYKSN